MFADSHAVSIIFGFVDDQVLVRAVRVVHDSISREDIPVNCTASL